MSVRTEWPSWCGEENNSVNLPDLHIMAGSENCYFDGLAFSWCTSSRGSVLWTSLRPSRSSYRPYTLQLYFRTATIFPTVLYMDNDLHNDIYVRSLWKSLYQSIKSKQTTVLYKAENPTALSLRIPDRKKCDSLEFKFCYFANGKIANFKFLNLSINDSCYNIKGFQK